MPLPQGKDSTKETFENSRIRQMINDLLRLDINIYWSKKDLNLTIQNLHQNKTLKKHFKKGAYIIPFQENQYKNIQAISITSDYNKTHELDKQNKIKNKAYLIAQPITNQFTKLNETKIAQHFSKSVRYSWPSYLQIADAGGFLTYEYLYDNETEQLLKNKDFNAYIWPYLPDPATFAEQYNTLSNIKQTNAIRDFVRKGGGYLGTCYGTYAASSGFINPLSPLSLLFSKKPYLNKIKPSFSLSLTDTLIKIDPVIYIKNHIIQVKSTTKDSPVFFGVNNTIDDFLKSPLFATVGENTQILAIYHDVKTDMNSITKNKLIGEPCWVTSTFGKGRVILYDSHPDFVNNITPLFRNRKWDQDPYYGRRVIHNSLFYATEKKEINVSLDYSFNISYIRNIIKLNNNLSLNKKPDNFYNISKQKLKQVSSNISEIKNLLIKLENLYLPLENKSIIFEKGKRFLQYGIWYCDIYQDFLNRSYENLETIEKIIPLINNLNISYNKTYNDLKKEIQLRLNRSSTILTKVGNIAIDLKNKFSSDYISILTKLFLLKGRRNLFEIFSKNLRYIPQTCFESLKTLRYLWYNYEASNI